MMKERLTDWVRAAQAGDVEAYGRVVRRVQDRLYAVAYGLLGDPHAAEDATQDALVEAYATLGRLRDAEAFSGWLRRMVVNRCRTMQRRSAARPRMASEVADTAPSPARRAEQSELARQVRSALLTLPEPHRLVTALYYLQGESTADIAAFLDVPVTTVKKRLHDARRKLKQRMLTLMSDDLRDHAPSQNDRLTDAVALRIAVQAADLQRIESLVRKDISLTETLSNDGLPMLLEAAHQESHGAISGVSDLLLRLGAEPDAHAAAALGLTDRLDSLLDEDPDRVEARDGIGATPLLWAAHNGHLGCLALLLDRGAVIDAQDQHHWQPLQVAAELGHAEVVERLLDRGADLHCDLHGWNLAHIAIEAGHVGLTERLLERGLSKDLFVASGLGDAVTVRALLDGDPGLAGASLPVNNTAVQFAAWNGHAAVADLLVARGAPLDVLSVLALGRGDQLPALMEAHPDMLDRKVGPWGQTALHHAVHENDLDQVELLLAHGADTTIKDDSFDGTPLGWAEHFHREAAAERLRAAASFEG